MAFTFKLGKSKPKKNKKTLKFSRYMTPDAPLIEPPSKVFLEYKIPPDTIGMYANDQYGDCVFAGIAHWLMLITAHAGTMIVPTLDDVLNMYSAVTGFDPSQTQPDGSNPTDKGCAVTDALSFWQSTGLCGHKIDGWAAIDPKNLINRRLGLYLFLGVGVGVQLPYSAQDQFDAKQTWDTVSGGVAGGHFILESGEGSDGHNYETWGKGDQKGTNDWDAQCTDESYIVLTHDLVESASAKTPFGFDYAALQNALTAMRA